MIRSLVYLVLKVIHIISYGIISKLSHCIVIFALISLHIIPQFGRIISESQTIINFSKVEYFQHCVMIYLFISFFQVIYQKRFLNQHDPNRKKLADFPPFHLSSDNPRSPRHPRIVRFLGRNAEKLKSKGAAVGRKTAASRLKRSELIGKWYVVDGSEVPNNHLETTGWMFFEPCKNGINYQTQLVSLPDFWTINSICGPGFPPCCWEPIQLSFQNCWFRCH